MGFQNPIVGGTALRIPAIQSPNYAPGTTGWIIAIDGSAEFNNLTVRGTFDGNDFVLNSAGLFIYDGTPAAGNLSASLAPNQGTDAFGNTYLAGVVTYAGTTFAALQAGDAVFGIVTDAARAGRVGLSGGDEVFASSPTSATNTAAATFALVDGLTSVTPQSAAGYPHIDIGASSNGLAAWLHGALVYATANGGVSTAETWQTPSYAASWAGTTTFSGTTAVQTLRYRRDGEDNVWFEGAFTVTGAGAGAIPFTVPAAYHDNQIHMFPVMEKQTGGGAFQVGAGYMGSTGNFHIDLGENFTRNSGDAFYVNARVPLGNIG